MTKARTLADNFAADINQVNAGVGITGGGTSGTVTITNDMATTINAAGDLLYGTANDAYTRLGIGTAGQYLKVNSGATAPEWATLSAGGMTQLATGSVGTGTSLSLTSISASYKTLYLVCENMVATGTTYLNIRINNTSSDYNFTSISNNTISGTGSGAQILITPSFVNNIDNTTNSRNLLILEIPNYSSTIAYKTGLIFFQSNVGINNYPDLVWWNNSNSTLATSAVNRIDLRLGALSQNFSNGTYTLFGVS